ncbi:unnamed protein product [Polarella glacialis]|uniref:U-box domain-containing protein n=1 Tax=Polarella glacialis TaxID=89957 RepID=A0A813HU13_POLGL|nr:unnamed protein product [Polarella glacialis]
MASAVTMLEPLGEAMDSFAIEIFAGLVRLEELLRPSWTFADSDQGGRIVIGALQGEDDEYAYFEETGLYHAFQGVCVWALALVVRAVGYSHFTAQVLWEHAGGGPLGVQMFAKCALCFQPELSYGSAGSLLYSSSLGIRAPDDLPQLRDAIMGALLGLVSPDVAFANCANVEDGSIGIEVRNAELQRHHDKLAQCAEQCGLLECIFAFPWLHWPGATLRLPALVDFLATLSCCSVDKPPAFVRQVDAWKHRVSLRSMELWSIIVPLCQAAPSITRGFLRDCATLAYASPPSAETYSHFVHVCLSGRPGGGFDALLGDSLVLAALISFAINSSHSPSMDALTDVVVYLDSGSKGSVASRLCSWQGPLRTGPFLSDWLELLKVPHAENGTFLLPEPPAPLSEVPELVESVPVPETVQLVPNSNGLREIVCDAPAEFCCAVDGRLLVDPVRAPSGHVFERSVLARSLKASGGLCPITGAALELGECQRDTELRARILKWVRQSRPRQRLG